MFSKTKEPLPVNPIKPVTQQKSSPPSLFSADLHLVGNITTEGEIHIDGIVDGEIRGRIVLIGESANIKGEIIADQLTIHGTISGQIKARSVNLAKTARVTGDILHEDLSIQTGAYLEGHCRRINHKKELAEAKANLLNGTPDPLDTAKKGPGGTPRMVPQPT